MLKITIGKFEFNEKEAREVYKELDKIFKNVTFPFEQPVVIGPTWMWPTENDPYKVTCDITEKEKLPYYICNLPDNIMTIELTNNLDFSYGELNE
jgi:hypothetical protein